MEKITIDKSSCIGCGFCVRMHPEYLVFDEMRLADPIDKEISKEDKPRIIETTGNCPTEAIKIEEN